MATGSDSSNTTCFSIILAEPASLELGQWVRDVVQECLAPPIGRVVLVDVGATSGDDSRFYDAALRALEEAQNDINNNSGSDDRNEAAVGNVVCLLIAVFWDSQSEDVKTDFIRLRQLADGGGARGSHGDDNNSNSGGATTKLKSLPHSKLHLLVQALNAKKGAHTLKENRDALVNSLRKKLPASTSGVCAGGGSNSSSAAHHMDPCNTAAVAAAGSQGSALSSMSVPPSSTHTKVGLTGATDLSESAVAESVKEGQGECFIVVSADSMEEFTQRVAQLQSVAKKIDVGCSAVVEEPREVSSSGNGTTTASGGNSGNSKAKVVAQEFLLRQNESEPHIELRLAMCGNVDSGKSTLTSVLTRGCRDDGRGLARTFVFKHKHEASTGRTSSVSENHLGFSSTGEVVNYGVASLKRGGGGGMTNWQLAQEVVAHSAKVLTLYDLAGHERYLKTTVLGMTRNMPDYACVVISANNGIQRMTKEHLALCLALKIPFFVIVTRIDSTPANVREETLASIHKLLKIPTVRKLPCPVRRVDDVVLCAKNLRGDRIAPVFEVSNVTGDGLPHLVRFLNLLPVRKDWRAARALPREMVIDSTFFVTGVGTVVGGIVTQGVFRVNDAVLLGPDGLGAYRTVHIKSIHVKGVEQQEALAGCDAAFCLKKERRSAIRKGNILADPQFPVKAYWQFEADVTILYHSTTILVNYEPVIHSTTVRQSARIVYVAREVLRTGDRSLVRFHFLYRPEFMKVGQQLIFREGRTKGIGTVKSLIAARDESLIMKRRPWNAAVQ
ncbi:GTP-binding elongation factor Tu family [Trypanosoma grayi]|uniref:GTP-binding elongation factor Tu family n=1 Tax=Trypanosoma grayi TaxID=71804 RepID=UPI0004F413CB|nr:GTP-binding elongation factor Tu family [Trypanosoma grayi]KEG07095.1 GTP-binding elongation factor Tu family [Trypanosoma grayi]